MDVLRVLNLKARMTFFREFLNDNLLPSSQSAAIWKRTANHPSTGVPSSMTNLLGFHEVSKRGEKTLVPLPNLTV